MLYKKPFLVICILVFSAFVFTGCPASTTSNTSTDTTASGTQTVAPTPAPDTTAAKDTTGMDSAGQRPIKDPHP